MINKTRNAKQNKMKQKIHQRKKRKTWEFVLWWPLMAMGSALEWGLLH